MLGQGVALVSSGGDALDYVEEAAKKGDKINPEELLSAMMQGSHSQNKNIENESMLRSYRGIFHCIENT